MVYGFGVNIESKKSLTEKFLRFDSFQPQYKWVKVIKRGD